MKTKANKKCPRCQSSRFKEKKMKLARIWYTHAGIKKEDWLYVRKCFKCGYSNDQTAKPAFVEFT